MNISVYFLIFIFGTIIGSFLNVVILRFNTGRGITGGVSIVSEFPKIMRTPFKIETPIVRSTYYSQVYFNLVLVL